MAFRRCECIRALLDFDDKTAYKTAYLFIWTFEFPVFSQIPSRAFLYSFSLVLDGPKN